MKHLISILDLNTQEITRIIEKARQYKTHNLSNFACDKLAGQVVAKLFFEPSTRTRNSFEIAAYRLGAFVISPDMKESALVKGETIEDTIQTIEAMGVHACVVRHAEDGIMQTLTQQTKHMAIVNAGDGKNQHPTQALIDLTTIAEHFSDWKNLRVCIIGDVKYSRVARSLINGLQLMGVHDIRLVAPAELLPDVPIAPNLAVFENLAEGLVGANVIVCLRLQIERMEVDTAVRLDHFIEKYCLTEERLTLAATNAIVMHPGPVNRDVEISSAVVDGPQSVVLKQVANGIAVRMSVLEFCLMSGPTQ